jgi:hypothetical protein
LCCFGGGFGGFVQLRWEDFEIDGPGPGVEEWRRYHHVRHSYKALFVTVALAGVLVALVSAVLLGNVEPREISEQAVRFSGPVFLFVFMSFVLSPKYTSLMQGNVVRILWNRLEHPTHP